MQNGNVRFMILLTAATMLISVGVWAKPRMPKKKCEQIINPKNQIDCSTGTCASGLNCVFKSTFTVSGGTRTWCVCQ